MKWFYLIATVAWQLLILYVGWIGFKASDWEVVLLAIICVNVMHMRLIQQGFFEE